MTLLLFLIPWTLTFALFRICGRDVESNIAVCRHLSNIRGAIQAVDDVYYLPADFDLAAKRPGPVAILSALDVRLVGIHLLHQCRGDLVGSTVWFQSVFAILAPLEGVDPHPRDFHKGGAFEYEYASNPEGFYELLDWCWDGSQYFYTSPACVLMISIRRRMCQVLPLMTVLRRTSRH